MRKITGLQMNRKSILTKLIRPFAKNMRRDHRLFKNFPSLDYTCILDAGAHAGANIEHRTAESLLCIGRWTLDVERWAFALMLQLLIARSLNTFGHSEHSLRDIQPTAAALSISSSDPFSFLPVSLDEIRNPQLTSADRVWDLTDF